MNVAARTILVGVLSVACASCGASEKRPAAANGAAAANGTNAAVGPANGKACRDAYAEYETRWKSARTDELVEFVAGDPDILEEILFYELATLPSHAEVEKLREIYAVVEAFLWNAPWPQALAASEVAIDHCGERAARPG